MKETVDFSKLVNDAVSGDSHAFDELYRLTYKTAYHTASLLLKNADDVEDVLQNAYIKAYKKLHELNNPGSFEIWIKSIVENECKNYIKKEKRIRAPVIFFKNKVDENAEEWNHPIPQEYMEREELRKSVSDILDKLSPEVRACIVLFHYGEKSLNEISEILDIPLGTVKSRLYNGRKQIEKEFNKLRKKDPTLLGIGAIPVLLSLLSYQEKNIAVPATISEGITASLTGAASAASSATAGSAVTATTAAASGSVATTATASIAVKVAAVAVAGSVAVGGSVAIKNHVENKAANESTSAYFSTLKNEETGTVAETLPETSTSTVVSTAVSSTYQSSITSNSQTSTTQHQSTTTERYTATTVRQSTTAKPTVTTTKATTKPTTTKAVTTTKPTTTEPPTTNPENNYGASGGVITEYTGDETYVTIPSSVGGNTVTAVGSGAFSGNTSIRSVSLPSTVTQIGQEAFADCTSLSSVSLPSSLELIGIGTFYGCSDLTSVSIPNGTKTISDEAFAQCTSLQTVTIPSSVTSISDDAFDGCNSLTIRCEEGSAAHDFAVANGINFSLI